MTDPVSVFLQVPQRMPSPGRLAELCRRPDLAPALSAAGLPTQVFDSTTLSEPAIPPTARRQTVRRFDTPAGPVWHLAVAVHTHTTGEQRVQHMLTEFDLEDEGIRRLLLIVLAGPDALPPRIPPPGLRFIYENVEPDEETPQDPRVRYQNALTHLAALAAYPIPTVGVETLTFPLAPPWRRRIQRDS